MTTNLVHNAIVHNLPEQGTVQVNTAIRPGVRHAHCRKHWREAFTNSRTSTLTGPFQRGTERLRNDHAGVGLGLAIVKSITQAHDGTLTITPAHWRRAPRHGATTGHTNAHRQIQPSRLWLVDIPNGHQGGCLSVLNKIAEQASMANVSVYQSRS